MPKRAANELSDAEKHYIDLVAQRTDEDATTLFFTNTKEFNRLLRAALGVPTAQEDFKTSELCSRDELHGTCVDKVDFVTWPAMWQRMAFYAKVWNPRTGFTLKGPEIEEYKALIQQGIDLEQARIEQGGLPKALTLKYLRELLGNSE
jgi:hypothetical protein